MKPNRREVGSKSASLGALRADSSVDKKKARAEKILRDQAYTHLKEAVDEVRYCGQFVFWKNPDRAQGYASDYLRKVRNTAKKTAAEKKSGASEKGAAAPA